MKTVLQTVTPAQAAQWHCQAAMRFHLKGQPMIKLHLASEDMLGNANVSRVITERWGKAKTA